MKNHALSLALLSAAAAPCYAGFSFDAESGAVWTDRTDVRIPNEGGTFFSLADDLSADDPGAFFRGRATWHINPKHDVAVLVAPLEVDYAGSFDRPVSFNGADFRAGTPTTGLFRFDSYRLTYRYNFIRNDKVTFGMGITAKIRDAEVSLTQNGRTTTDTDTGFVPLINYQFAWRFARDFSLYSEGDALGAPQGYAVDVAGALQWHLTDNLAVRLGYRMLDGGADTDSVYTFNRFHYATVGATFQF
jgi:opacity protein-like surface antigen